LFVESNTSHLKASIARF